MNSGLNTPDTALITGRSYDACHFWVYLERRAGTYSAIKAVWANYQINGKNAKAAVNTVTTNRLGVNFDAFVQLWIKTNYIKDLANAPTYYDYAEDEVTTTSCGVVYGPLRHVPRITKAVLSNTTWTRNDSVTAYGADYYEFTLATTVKRVEIKIKGTTVGGNYSYHVIGIKSNQQQTLVNSTANEYTFIKTLTPGQWDKIGVVIGGRAIGGNYTISVLCTIPGKWRDNFNYLWTLNQSGTTITGTVVTTTCGTWNVSGTYTKPNITLTARIPSPRTGCCTTFTYRGTIRDNCSGSGTWTNTGTGCGFSGTWSMGKTILSAIPPEEVSAEEGPTPASCCK